MSVQSWSDGYVTEIDYEQFFFRDMSPGRLSFVCSQTGHLPPAMDRPFTYCELGSGLGLTTNVLAASNPQGRFWAADINPRHVVKARRLAEDAELENVVHLEASFEELLEMDLPRFDYITLHGIWSWVSPEARRDIKRFLRARLETGGVVYISYNNPIGWERRQTMGKVLRELVRAISGPLPQRIEIATGVIRGLIEQDKGYFAGNEDARKWLDHVGRTSFGRIAHEYLNEHWTLFTHPEVARDLASAKLDHVGSTDVLLNLDRYVLDEFSTKAAASLKNPAVTELLKDLEGNWSLRRDVYMRGPARPPAQAVQELLGRMTVYLLQPRHRLLSECKSPAGQSSVQPALFDPIADALAEGPHTLDELHARVPRFQFFDVLVVCSILNQNSLVELSAAGHNGDDGSAARRLNHALARRTLRGESFGALAAPAVGAGVTATDLEICCHHRVVEDGIEDPVVLARKVTDDLARIGRQPVLEKGKDDQESMATFCGEFLDQMVPLWRRMGVM